MMKRIELAGIAVVTAVVAVLAGCAGSELATQPESSATVPTATETAVPSTPSPRPSATEAPMATPSLPPTASPSPPPSATTAPPEATETVAGQSQEGTIIAGMNRPFQLRINQTAIVENEDLRVTFLDVTEDSRCPIGVQCIWEGQATVALGVAKGGQELSPVTLTLRAGMEHLAAAALDGYAIRLAAVDPYPKQGRQTQPSDYVVTLVVSAGGGG